MPKSKTFVYITKHTAATLSLNKIILVSIVLNLTCRNVREEYIFISVSQVIEFSSRGYKINCNNLKVRNEFMWSLFLPKCQPKISQISALINFQGRNPSKILIGILGERHLEFILILTDL